jgi:hypothetical protein
LQDTVQGNPYLWKPSIIIRYDALENFGREPMIIAGLAACGGLLSLNEMELAPGNEKKYQALRLLGTTQKHNEPFAGQQYSTQQTSTGGIHTSPVSMASVASALLEADALAGAVLHFSLHLRKDDGTLVRAAQTAPPGYVEPGNLFSYKFHDSIQSDAAGWSSLSGYIPYQALAPDGETQTRLIINYGFAAGPLRAFSEEDFSPPPSALLTTKTDLNSKESAPDNAVSSSSPGSRNPEEQAVRTVVQQYMDATARKDEETLRNLTTGRLAATRKPAADTALQLRYDIQQVTVRGNTAGANVHIDATTPQGQKSDLLMRLQFELTATGWKIAWLEFEPYLKGLLTQTAG